MSQKYPVFNIVVYISLAILCLFPFATAPLALFAGLSYALIFGSIYPKFNKTFSKYLLQVSVVGLGFGMNLNEALKAGADGIVFTVVSVVTVMVLGVFVGKRLKVPTVSAYLISSGTAICGGSAIAATGPIAKASDDEMSVSLATIFILNAIALFIFPVMGHWLELTQNQFGLWAAIAIHDTSSVVGAAASYGDEALKVATTVKLTRALWIIPLSIFTSFYFKSDSRRISIPWFIFFFILAMLLNSFVDIPQAISSNIVFGSKKALTLTLFFIGTGLTRSNLKNTGTKPLILGVLLWIFIGLISLFFIKFIY